MIPHSKPWITQKDLICVTQQLSSLAIADKSALGLFVDKLKEKCLGREVILCSSGTAALYVVLCSLNLNKTDEIILPTYVCGSVYNAVKLVGAVPVLCDVGENWNMTPESVEPHINQNTKAIIVVNLYGLTEPIEPFRKFGRTITIINDLCQNFDAGLSNEINDRDRGDYLIFSFHATKCLTTGVGGAIVAFTEKESCVLSSTWLKFKEIFPMSDMQAALGISQLTRYSEFQARREQLANLFFNSISNNVVFNLNQIRSKWNGYRFLIKHSSIDFEKHQQLFFDKNIMVRRGVDDLLHRNLKLNDTGFPNAVAHFNQTISIPFYPALAENEAEKIINTCRGVMAIK